MVTALSLNEFTLKPTKIYNCEVWSDKASLSSQVGIYLSLPMYDTTWSVCWELHFFHSSQAASVCEPIASHCMASGCEARRGQIYPEPGPAPVVFTSQHIVMFQSWEWVVGPLRHQWETCVHIYISPCAVAWIQTSGFDVLNHAACLKCKHIIYYVMCSVLNSAVHHYPRDNKATRMEVVVKKKKYRFCPGNTDVFEENLKDVCSFIKISSSFAW